VVTPLVPRGWGPGGGVVEVEAAGISRGLSDGVPAGENRVFVAAALASLRASSSASTTLMWMADRISQAQWDVPIDCVVDHPAALLGGDWRRVLYDGAPVPASFPPSTMRYSSRIFVPAKYPSRISRVPAA
jgi:hypothetical protein